MSRAERKAKHQEANKQLWESAENPEQFRFVESRNGGVPLANATFKPALKVLSRKPAQATDGNGAQPLGTNEDDIDSEEEERREQERVRKEKNEQAAAERAEKQRKYAEVRERLFGTTTPSAESQSGRDSPTKRSGGRTRGRGGMRGGASGKGSRSASSAEQSPTPHGEKKQLFDPNDSTKSEEKRKPLALVKPDVLKPTRQPRGADGSGRGGFGFTPTGRDGP